MSDASPDLAAPRAARAGVRSILPGVTAVVVILLLLAGAAFLVPTLARPDPNVWAFPGFPVVASSMLLLLGLAIATRQPENAIGWLFLFAAVMGALGNAGSAYAYYAVSIRQVPDLGASLGRWVESWTWIPLMQAVTTFLFVLFPDGRPASPRWRWLLRFAAAAGAVAVLATAVSPSGEEFGGGISNPFAIDALAPVMDVVAGLALLGVTLAMFASVAALLLRLRAADGIERKQVQWLLAAGVLISLPFGLYLAAPSKLGEILITLGFLSIPTAATVAILRYRLWDIDVIVNRTLVYVPLTGLLTGLYTIAVTAFQRAFVVITGEESDAPVILSALVLASLFTPIKNRLQAAVDARFKGDADPTGRLIAFEKELRADYRLVEPLRLGHRLLDLVAGATGASAVHLELRAAGRTDRLGTPPEAPAVSVPLEAAGRAIGRLDVGPRVSGRPYRQADADAIRAAAAAVAQAIDDLARGYPRA